MSRVDELQKKYPDIPREVIIEWDCLSQGITDSEVLDKVTAWERGGSYQSRNHYGVTLKGMAEKRPESVRPGYVMRPNPFYMKDGIGVRIIRALSSPYEIKEVGDKKYALFEGEDKVEDIYFSGPKPRESDAVTSKGTPVTSLVSGVGRCFRIAPVRFCEYFTQGVACKFCNYNSSYEDARSIGIEPPKTINLEDTVEAYKIVSSNVRLIEGHFQMGAFRSSKQEAKVYFDFVEKIASGASYTPNMTISTQPMDRRGMQRLRDAGLSCLEFNTEVWGAELFEEVCPGKATYRGFERYKEAYMEATDVFGAGNVLCNFVAGVSLVPENGHKTWQEARDSLAEGFRWLIKTGVLPTFTPLRLAAGSFYGDNKANWKKSPPVEFYLETALAHHRAMMEYDLYSKYNKLSHCALDCIQYTYGGEIGMITLAGNIANWAADAVPADANWIAKFIARLESETTAK